MHRSSLPFLLVLLTLVAAPLLAQERQVPLDVQGRLLEIDRELAQRLGLFTDEHPGLEVARLFRDEAGGWPGSASRSRRSRPRRCAS